MNIAPARDLGNEKGWLRIIPVESNDVLLNPHKGVATFQRFNGADLFPPYKPSDAAGPMAFQPFDGNITNRNYPQTTVAYCRWYWEILEPVKGRYRWDIIDGALEAARVRGQTLQVRLMPHSAQSEIKQATDACAGVVPAWFVAIAPTRRKDDAEKGIIIPIYDSPEYLRHWGDLIRSFAERYDGHPGLESFDVSYIGPWGEGGGECNEEGIRRMTDLYCNAFSRTPLISMIGYYQYEYGMQKGNGWRADSFGDIKVQDPRKYPTGWNHMYDFYPREVCLRGGRDAWKTRPVVMEPHSEPNQWERDGFDVEWIIAQGLKYHTSIFMPKSCPMSERMLAYMEKFIKRMGYRFVLRQFTIHSTGRRGDFFPYLIWIENIGVAPIYRKYDLAIRFRQGNRAEIVVIPTDITKWLPGDEWLENNVIVPENLEPGKTDVDVALVDPQTKVPCVQFAVKGCRDDGWHPMAAVELT